MSSEVEAIATTVDGAARRLAVSISTIRAMLADGRLPFKRIVGRSGERGRIVIKLADVDALLQ